MRNNTSSASSSAKTPCCIKVGLKRGPWTPKEDELLANYIKKDGEGRWRTLPKRAGLLRCGKSCRLRWMNYLRPSVKRGQIAPDEEDLILRLHRLLGNRWALIAGRIPGRTDNEIKNYWNTHLSKKLISQGIDPRTHKPLNPNSSSSSPPDLNKASPSSKAKTVANPRPSPNSSEKSAVDKETGNFLSKNNQDHQIGPAGNDGRNSDGSGIGWRRSTGDNNEDDEDDLNCGTDDVFSSFLNSLINEEVFAGHQHLQQQQHHGGVGLVAPGSDALISSSSVQSFGFVTGWEAAAAAAAAASTSALGQPDKRL